jgi:hypothetical protein
VNRNGTPTNLVPSHPQNTSAAKHAVYSPRLREPRAREIAEHVLSAPWTCDLDAIGAAEIGRLLALIEALDDAIANAKAATLARLIDQRIRASRRLLDWLGRYGMTPHARAEWAASLGGDNLAAEIARRRAELNGCSDA